ncbi:hypothetical protein WG66_010402 [Moniliophthora roreri]|nr:hypothetical protein WG66_010402 [Moniliophthora roreri]
MIDIGQSQLRGKRGTGSGYGVRRDSNVDKHVVNTLPLGREVPTPKGYLKVINRDPHIFGTHHDLYHKGLDSNQRSG